MRQLTFHAHEAFKDHKPRLEHGGSVRQGKRKLARPFDSKRPLHLVLRSQRAKGNWSFLRPANSRVVNRQIYGLAQKHGVKIFDYANGGNHLHILAKGQTQKGFQNFLRTLGALLSRQITGARKGHPIGRFWDAPAYSKVLFWGKAFQRVKRYLTLNTLEAFGFLPARHGLRTKDEILSQNLEGYLAEKLERQKAHETS